MPLVTNAYSIAELAQIMGLMQTHRVTRIEYGHLKMEMDLHGPKENLGPSQNGYFIPKADDPISSKLTRDLTEDEYLENPFMGLPGEEPLDEDEPQ